MHHTPWQSRLRVIFSSPCQSYQLLQMTSQWNGLQQSYVDRCSGDPVDPLILYIHGSGTAARGRDSKMWNGLVTSFGSEMAKAEEQRTRDLKAQLAREQVSAKAMTWRWDIRVTSC